MIWTKKLEILKFCNREAFNLKSNWVKIRPAINLTHEFYVIFAVYRDKISIYILHVVIVVLEAPQFLGKRGFIGEPYCLEAY